MSKQQTTNETKFISVEVTTVCTNCMGEGKTCDYNCAWNKKTFCEHRKTTWCNCRSGMSTKDIFIPKSIIDEWTQRQHEIPNGYWNNEDIISEDDDVMVEI